MSKLQTFAGIMLFYAILAFIIMPGLFYYFNDKSFQSAGLGFVAGSVLSIILWFFYGSKMV